MDIRFTIHELKPFVFFAFKHIFDFFLNDAQILLKCGSYMHPSKVSKVC